MSDRQTPSDICQPNSDEPLNERMRHKAQNGEMVDQYFTEAGQLLNEGADKITALEAQLADAQEAATSFERWFNKWRAEAERLEAQLAAMREAGWRLDGYADDEGCPEDFGVRAAWRKAAGG